MTGRVSKKVVVVTGAARGIGRGCARMLAREGACVVIGDIQNEEGTEAVAAIRGDGGDATFRRVDVMQEQQCADLMEFAVSTYGRLDALVNNVGWFPRATLEETTSDLWEQVLSINLRSAFYCSKYAVAYMRDAGAGSIVNIGSIHGIQGIPTLVAYSAAKGGLLSMTRTLAGAYAHEGIRVNYVIPGWVLTEGEIALQTSRGIDEQELRHAGDSLPLGRHQTVDDTGYAVIYLVSDESSQMTGAILPVDAGMSSLPITTQGSYVG